MICYDNLIYITLLQIFPSCLFYMISWTYIDNIIAKPFVSIAVFSIWSTFNSICIRKTRYRSKNIILFGVYREPIVIGENTLIIPNDNRISIVRTIIIVFPTIITILFILNIIFYITKFLKSSIDSYNTEGLVINIIIDILSPLFILLLSIATFYIGTGYMDWNRGLVASQHGFAMCGLYFAMGFGEMSISIYGKQLSVLINSSLVTFLSLFPILFTIVCGLDDNIPKIKRHTIVKSIGNRDHVSKRVVINSELGIPFQPSVDNKLVTSESIDNLVDYDSGSKIITI